MIVTDLPDIQKTKDTRGIFIQKAGICNLHMPVYIKMKDNSNCHTIADIEATVSVGLEVKGTNMSRLPIFIQDNKMLTLDLIEDYTSQMREICGSDRCDLVYRFPYFLTKEAPISKLPGVVSYDCYFKVINNNDHISRFIGITAIASTCCPCSKEISDYNAHNQKCYISLECEVNKQGIVWLEDLIKAAESCSSCEIFTVLKRPDEKYVTEHMYDHPQFVEDVVRDAHLAIQKIPQIKEFKVSAKADESIHMHKACASIATSGWYC